MLDICKEEGIKRNTNKSVKINRVLCYRHLKKLCNESKFSLARKHVEEYKLQYEVVPSYIHYFEAILCAHDCEYEKAYELFNQSCFEGQDLQKSLILSIFILIEMGKYEKAYELFNEIDLEKLQHDSFYDYKKCCKIRCFLQKKLNIFCCNNKKLSYGEYQILNYDAKKAINHINNKHNIDETIVSDIYCILIDYDKLVELFDEITSMICISNKTFSFDVSDSYYFRIKDIGINLQTGNKTDILFVATNKDTNQILTMYPIKEIYGSDIIINEETTKKEEFISGKVRKRTSQIEKFNNKYNL